MKLHITLTTLAIFSCMSCCNDKVSNIYSLDNITANHYNKLHELIPNGWTVLSSDNEITVNRLNDVAIINMINRDWIKIGESNEEYEKRHVTSIPYKYSLTFLRGVSKSTIDYMIASNKRIREQLVQFDTTYPYCKSNKYPTTPEETDKMNKYKEMKSHIVRIPNYYCGNYAIVVDDTNIGLSKIYKREVEVECDNVFKIIESTIMENKDIIKSDYTENK